MAVINGKIRNLALHQQRLDRSCAQLGWSQASPIDPKLQASQSPYVCKLFYFESGESKIAFHDWPDYKPAWSENGVECVICPQTLAHSATAGIKFTERALYKQATSYWQEKGVQEGLLCDKDGYLIEGTKTNIFWEKGGDLYTPSLDHCGVRGTMREHVINLAKTKNQTVIETQARPSELNYADTIFLTNALIGTWHAKICD